MEQLTFVGRGGVGREVAEPRLLGPDGAIVRTLSVARCDPTSRWRRWGSSPARSGLGTSRNAATSGRVWFA